MPVLSAQNISLAFLDKTLFCDVTFAIEKTDRIGLIGANGAGKTTLFRLLLRQLEPTEGAIIMPAGTRIGCVEQHACRDSSKTAYEEVLTVYSDVIEMERELESINRRLSQSPDAALIDRQEQLREAFEARDGLSYRSRARAALLGLGFSAEETDKPVGILSGGQRTKISLAKLLLSGADLILLDEPTNHLDTESVEWLEDFLKKYTGAAMIISHDRYFLDKVTTKTMELQGGRFFFTKGSYSTYQQLKQERLLFESRENEKIEKEIDRLKAMIEQQRRFNRERNYITIASKEKQIARLKEGLHETVRTPDEMRLRFPVASESGNEVLSAQNLSKTFTKPLFSGVSFDLRKGERVFLLGPNGCGKTTLLKMILGEITPDTGAIRFGAGVRIGYFEQTQSALSSDKTVLQEVYDRFPDKTVPELRKILAAFLFRGDDIDKTMRDLSGGERAKVALLEIMLRGCNFLILDEPTNHLDIESREVLENALAEYEGTILAVSHDRYFINRLATKLLCFDGGTVRQIDGNYDSYLLLREQSKGAEQKAPTVKKPNAYQLKKETARRQRLRKGEIARLEKQIAELEEQKTRLQNQLASPEVTADYLQITELTEALDEVARRQDELTEQWLALSEEEE